jgi:SAM-dependent methyltransferase
VKIGDRHQIGAVKAAKRLVFLLRNLEPVTDFHPGLVVARLQRIITAANIVARCRRLEVLAMSETNTDSTSSQFDPKKAETFAGRLMSALNDAGFCLMASVGHRTGLFDAMRDQPPLTSRDIASRARLDERYVREWLGAMATAGAVDVDPATTRFSLPAEHAAFLTRAAGANNMAVFAQLVAMLGEVENDIVECFRKGGGVPYEKYPRFHCLMAEDQTVLSSLESRILPLVPGLTSRLTKGIRVLDVGCGSGRVLNRLAELYQNSRFAGMDLSPEAVERARSEAAEKGLRNTEFIVRDLSDFDQTAEPESFDFITTFDAIHDQGRPLKVLQGICRALKTDGVYLMQDINGSSHVDKDIGHPLGTFLYTVSCMHCMTVSLAQGGEGVGAMWGEERTREYLQRAGFRSIETHRLEHDIMNNWYVIRK